MSRGAAKAFFLLAWTLGLASSTWGQGADQSPFSTPQPQVQSQQQQEEAPTSLDTFEFNGIMKFGGKTRISVFDTKEKKNYWLTAGEVGEMGLSLQRIDEQNESVVIAQGGILKRLVLKKVQIEPLRIADTPPPPPGATGATATVGPPPPPSVESDEEARARIQRVAEEIRRRRAERRARLEERGQGGGN